MYPSTSSTSLRAIQCCHVKHMFYSITQRPNVKIGLKPSVLVPIAGYEIKLNFETGPNCLTRDRADRVAEHICTGMNCMGVGLPGILSLSKRKGLLEVLFS